MTPEERDLLGRLKRRDDEAWSALWNAHAGPMRRALASHLGSGAEAEEVCQAVFARLASDGGRALGSFSGRCRLGTWLVAVALRQALDHLRARRDSCPPTRHQAEEVPSALSALCQAESTRGVGQAMARLSARDHLLLRLLFWDGSTHDEAARMLGVSPHSVTTLRERALERLKSHLVTGE